MKKKLSRLVCTSLTLCALAPVIHAADITWDNELNNNWLEPLNWSTNTVPSGDNAVFSNAAAGPANITADIPNVNDILFQDGSGTINQSAGNASLNGWFRMGTNSGSGGTYNLSGGQINAGRYNFAESNGSTGLVNITGGTLRQNDVGDPTDGNNWSRIGDGGAATFNVSAGLASFDSRLIIGNGGTGSAVVTQTGGIVETRRGQIDMGDSSPNVTYNISGGTLRTVTVGIKPTDVNNRNEPDITLGQWDNSNATLQVSGNALVSSARELQLAVGRGTNDAGQPVTNRGTVLQSGGTVQSVGNLVMANNAGGTANYTLDSGTLNVGSEMLLATSAGSTANYTQNGGTATVNRAVHSSTAANSTSTLTVTGGTLTQPDVADINDQGTWSRIGENGSTNFNLSGTAAVSFDARLLLGANAGSTATINQSGGTLEVRRGEFTIGDNGSTVIYNLSGGTVISKGSQMQVGNWDNANATMNITGTTSKVIVTNDFIIGNGNDDNTTITTGQLSQSNGVVQVGNNLLIANKGGARGSYTLSGNGVLDLTGGNVDIVAGIGGFIMPGGTVRNASSIDANSATFATNPGVFQQGGRLEVGATPGAGAATTINGNYSLVAGGTVEFEISTGVADSLTVNGGTSITLAGNISLVSAPGMSFPQTFTIVNNNTGNPINGAFANAPDDTNFFTPGYTWKIDYQGGDGNDAVLTLVVPEPGTGALLFGGAAATLFLRRRRTT